MREQPEQPNPAEARPIAELQLPPLHVARVMLLAALIWSAPALLLTTHQWRELYGTIKHMSWLEALAFQAPSWLLLIPATPLLFAVVRRYALRAGEPKRLAMHGLASLMFGVAFLLIAVPTRNLVHPQPFQWEMFGKAVYKSVPQFVLMGTLAYWAITLVASLVETRLRLHAVLSVGRASDTSERKSDAARSGIVAPDSVASERDGPSEGSVATDQNGPLFVILSTSGGRSRLPAAEVCWIEPASGGARMHTSDCGTLIRHTLAELESILPTDRFVRLHRSYIVNIDRIREIIGSPSRDGRVRLDTGALIPVSRRRRAELDARLAGSTHQLAFAVQR